MTIEDAQIIIDTLTSSYVKGMMAFKEGDFKRSPKYMEMFSMPEEIWEILNDFSWAKSWDDVPFHEEHDSGCTACEKFRR